MKLDVGSGTKQAPGYKTVDQYCDADYQLDITELDKFFDENSIDEIRSSHSLEHLPRSKVDATLRSWLKILKPGGVCWIDVPDMASVGKLLYEAELAGNKQKRDWYLTVMYGLQSSPGEFHVVGLTLTVLVEKMQAAGFKVEATGTEDSHAAPAIQVLARKPL